MYVDYRVHWLLYVNYFTRTIYLYNWQGIKAVIAESYERIHRSNLVGMGIIPFQYVGGQTADSLGLTGTETFSIDVPDDLKAGQELQVKVSVQGHFVMILSEIEAFDFSNDNKLYKIKTYYHADWSDIWF